MISPSDIKRVHWFVTALLVIVSALFAARLLSAVISVFIDDTKSYQPKPFVTSVKPKSVDEFLNYEVVVTRNLFNSKNEIPDDDVWSPENAKAGVYKKSTLDIELVGTIVVNDPSRSVAAIELKQDKKIDPFVIGDNILSKAVVVNIARRKVILRNIASGELEYIGMKEDEGDIKLADQSSPQAGIKQLGNDRVLLDRGELNKALGNINELLTQARAVPNIENGVVNGFKLFSIQPGSLYQKLGALNGDIIKSVNGVDIKDPSTAMSLYQQLQSNNRLEFKIERNGQPRTMVVDIR
ncbi:MAG: type II secretion system protein GspC [Pseudomonadota bacterium]